MLLDNIYILKAYVGLLSQAIILGHLDLVVARKDKTETLRHESTYVIPCIFIDERWCEVSCLPNMSILSSHVYPISNEEVK